MKYIIYLLLLNSTLLYSQSNYKNVKIFESKLGGPCEPSISINKNNTNEIVAGSVLDNIHRSTDGGTSWETEKLESNLGVYGDPCIISDTKGNFFYFHLSDPENGGWSSKLLLNQIVVQRSDNCGKTWTDGKGIGNNFPKQQDKEWATVNQNNNEIYVTWTQFDKYNSKSKKDSSLILFSKSTDNGETWTKAKRISKFAGNCRDDDNTVEGAVPAVNLKGEIFVAWAFDEKIYLNKSSDSGRTWFPEEKIITEQEGGWNYKIKDLNRVNGMPILVCDNSNGPNSGNLYLNWIDHKNGNPDVFVKYSNDGGNTWSEDIQINTETKQAEQFFTWMAIDQANGNIHIIYYDNSRNKDGSFDVILSSSYDGAKTFQNEVISESPFKVNNKTFFGDYNNIDVHNGLVRPIWTRMENKKLSIWTALIKK
ncbi:MAG: sialidase family protein [Bacteroidota bacterium]